jgi:hypothetical protein
MAKVLRSVVMIADSCYSTGVQIIPSYTKPPKINFFQLPYSNVDHKYFLRTTKFYPEVPKTCKTSQHIGYLSTK